MKIYCRGFTLYEMVVVLSMMALLLSLAVPSIASALLRHNNTLSYLKFVAALRYAQEEALRREVPLVVCAVNYNLNAILYNCLSTDNQRCQGWSCGSLSYLDLDHRGEYLPNAANQRVNATHLDHGVTITGVALPSGVVVRQLLISPDGLISDRNQSYSWRFSFSQTLFSHHLCTQSYLNRYGVFVPESGC